jgi:hypothetical protein
MMTSICATGARSLRAGHGQVARAVKAALVRVD